MPEELHAEALIPGDHESDIDDIDNATGPEQSLLNGSPSKALSAHVNREYKLTPMGRLRAYWLGTVVCIGGFLFGYDTGIIGGVLTLSSYQRDFNYDENSATRVSALAVGLQQLGAFVACFAIWPVTHMLGRRLAIAICSLLFIIGALVQTVNSHSTTTFILGRFIAGIGLGGSSVVVPMFSSEMTPKQIRGQVSSFFQLMFTLGIFTSYWIDWGVAKDISDSESKQWQIPVGLQMLFAGLLGIGTMTLKESTRWLAMKGRYDEAWDSLKWIRASNDHDVRSEMMEIKLGVELEAHAREGFQLSEMVQKGNFDRTVTAVCTFAAQQANGATAFAYFGPQYFKLLVGEKGNEDLLLTAIFGAVKVAACATFIVFVADNLPRKTILTCGALLMAACQISTAALVKNNPPPADGTITSSGIATVALIYLFVIFHNFSWAPLPWAYVSEIFTTRTREPGVAIGVASQWLFNFIFSFTTPYMIQTLGWGTFLVWGVFDVVIALYSWFALIETKGKSLEQIAHVDGATLKRDDDRYEYDEDER